MEKYTKTSNFPNDIPLNPRSVYKNEGWISMRNWIGIEFKSFEEGNLSIFKFKINLRVERL